MHIEKNVFDNIFNTVMDIKGKAKDNLNARKDLAIICNRPKLQVDERRPNVMPKAVYTLTKDQKRKKLIPVAFWEMVPEHVWSALTEVSLMFQVLCSTTLDIRKVQELEDSVAVIMCNLEKVFPPAFFDSMEHLILHVLYEAHKKVKNKAYVEASIVEVYIVEEIGWFTSHYFELHVTCKRRRPSRNDDLTPAARSRQLPARPSPSPSPIACAHPSRRQSQSRRLPLPKSDPSLAVAKAAARRCRPSPSTAVPPLPI
ncbi:hypothetical protein Sango_2442400 [Sesamum angolense]|uniref:DUF4218 domain-containing protein n=1 Tax=Sesamum angolense TaxID=2727404 RepID=A0AAE1W7T3_9LAMI|nr:hypothetical protein Sango_2442400 [Sesamum angolense]